MTDARWARLIMELRQAGVTDHRVLEALERVPRDAFVEPTLLGDAYDNRALPIGCGQTISQPLVVGLMSQALEVGERMKVLEIGTGSGYQAAVLARLCRRVYSIERHRDLMKTAEDRFARLGIRNITTLLGDGWKGWPDHAPFDRIIVTAAAPEIPQALKDQLAVGGIMVIPVGPEFETQELMQIRKTEAGLDVRPMFPVRFVPMVHGMAAPR
ncbi:MAG: protein-L-isoaspartate(D-aspartate) O-methyltransferase [Rhodospirillaceae bacterium]